MRGIFVSVVIVAEAKVSREDGRALREESP
jgi:hypothetical protein